MTKPNSPQNSIGETAQAMLNGTLNYLAGAIQLIELRDAHGIYANDPDFVPFLAVLAEIDTLPIGRNPKNWTSEVLTKHSSDIQQSITWAKDITQHHCEALAKRYAPQ